MDDSWRSDDECGVPSGLLATMSDASLEEVYEAMKIPNFDVFRNGLVTLGILGLMSIGLGAYDEDDGAAEQAGKSVDESIEAMRESIDEGLENAKDAIEETQEKIE